MTVGLIAVALVLGNSVLLGVPLSLPLLTAAFCGSSLVYWSDRVLGYSPEDIDAHPDRVAWVRSHRTVLTVEAAALSAGLLFVLPMLRVDTLMAAALCGLLGLVHVVPVLPGRRRMKALPWGKRTSIAATWAVGSTVLPWLEHGRLAEVDLPAAGLPEAGLPEAGAWAGGEASVFVLALLTAGRGLLVWANVALADWADRDGRYSTELRGIAEDRRPRQSEGSVRRGAVVAAAVGGGCALAAGMLGPAPLSLAMVDALGAGVMALAVTRLHPSRHPQHLLWLDLAVAWPFATFLAGLLLY